MNEARSPIELTAWFAEYQKNHIVKNGHNPKWFHGIISRKQAEEMLVTKPPGYFLIRVSESRIGYTLSYRTKDLCRHFMINILPGNQCEIIGQSLRHCSLHDLVAFHSRTPIHPYTELLTIACDQACQDFSEDTPPALPAHRMSYPPIPNRNLCISSDISVSPTRLYPNLEEELSALSMDSVGISEFILMPSELTTRWQLAHSNSITEGEQAKGLPTVYSQRMSEDKVQQRSQVESKQIHPNLIQCTKIFKKKKHTEDHTYTQINKPKLPSDPAILEMAAKRDHQEVAGVSGTLPVEYLNPPPFAPGY